MQTTKQERQSKREILERFFDQFPAALDTKIPVLQDMRFMLRVLQDMDELEQRLKNQHATR
jgi:hypothetical protein